MIIRFAYVPYLQGLYALLCLLQLDVIQVLFEILVVSGFGELKCLPHCLEYNFHYILHL